MLGMTALAAAMGGESEFGTTGSGTVNMTREHMAEWFKKRDERFHENVMSKKPGILWRNYNGTIVYARSEKGLQLKARERGLI